MIYNGRNFIPIAGKEETEQELECDFTWSTQHARKLLEDITDVNEEEKTLMKMRNEHVVKYDGLGLVNLARLLLDFAQRQASQGRNHVGYTASFIYRLPQ